MFDEVLATTNYREESIFKNIVLPLTDRYGEILWFADKDVDVTQENLNTYQRPGWTQKFIAAEKINFIPQKYIELERMLSSVVFLNLFNQGGDSEYTKLVSVQNEKEKLTRGSFEAIHCLAKQVIKDNDDIFKAIEAMLVYSDLGKTPKARKKAEEELGIKDADHDDWIEAVLNSEMPSKVIPSYFGLSIENKKRLKNVAGAMKIHLGHVLHLEGGERMFDKFIEAISKQAITEDILKFAFLVQLCDVAASAAQATPEGSLALTEETYQNYHLVYKMLDVIRNGASAKDALGLYLKERGVKLNLNIETSQEKVLIRLACMLRLYNEQDGILLQEAAKRLSPSCWQVLIGQFEILGGMNKWTRNPTYIPAVLVNLARFNDPSERRFDKILRALNGAVCVAKYLEYYAQEQIHKNSPTPLCFNSMAGLAAKDPAQFNVETFDPRKFIVNENNDIIVKEMKSLSLKF